jgi:predicted SAM-dependent methyltransferase
MPRKLHIGGEVRKEGWEVLNIQASEAVDHVGPAHDLSRFEDGTFDEVYASHILEHLDFTGELLAALEEWHRVLAPGGVLSVSVPDLDVLAELFLAKDQLTLDERFLVMCMIFGGHTDVHDYHKVGLNFPLLRGYLRAAGFVEIERVPELGVFDDTSSLRFKGRLISVNTRAKKPD